MRKNLLEGNTTSVSLEHHMERLALEANFITTAFTNLQGMLPQLTDKFSVAVNGLFDSKASPAAETLFKVSNDVDAVVKLTSYNSFATFDRTLVTVPEGLQGNLLTYATALTLVSREVYATADEALSVLQQQLSTFISNSEIKQSNKDKTGDYKKAAKQREDITKEVGKFFTDKNVRSKMYMSEAIGSFEEIDDLYKKVKTLADLNNKTATSAIERKTNEVLNLLKLVYEDMSTNPDTSVSGAAAKNIATGAYEAAKCVELVGAFNFRVTQVYACTHDLVVQLKKIMKTKH